MKLGIVGLPNVGKSTLFNALTSTQNAQAANYPFCTIEPNSGIVPVPDPRLDKLAEIWQTDKKTPAIVEFVDIAGLVKGASQARVSATSFWATSASATPSSMLCAASTMTTSFMWSRTSTSPRALTPSATLMPSTWS